MSSPATNVDGGLPTDASASSGNFSPTRSRSRTRGQSSARSHHHLHHASSQRVGTDVLLANVLATDLRLLTPDFVSGLSEAVVAIRSKRMSSALVKGALYHFAGSKRSDYVDSYYLLRVVAPEGDPGGAVLYLLRVKRPDTGEFIVDGVDLVIPVRGIVGVGAASISDEDPVKHFKITKQRVLASFVQGQVGLDIQMDPDAVEAHLRKDVPSTITGMRKVSQLTDNRVVLCFESMEERTIWLDFLTNLLMNVETADLRLEELSRRRRNKTIGPMGASLGGMGHSEASLILEDAGMPSSPASFSSSSAAAAAAAASGTSGGGSSSRAPLGPPPKPTNITPEDLAAYRMYHFKPEGNSGDGPQGSTAPPGNQQSITSPPTEGRLECKLRGEADFSVKKVTSKAQGIVIVAGAGTIASKTIDLARALVQATSPYARPFQIVKVAHDAESAQEEQQNGGPIVLAEFRADSPENRVKWIEWLIFARGAPQAEDDTYLYRAVERAHIDQARRQLAAPLGSKEEHDAMLGSAEPSSPSLSSLSKKASFNNQSSRMLRAPTKSDKFSDRSSLTSVGSHAYSKTKVLRGGGGGGGAAVVHDPWKDFTWGDTGSEDVPDPRSFIGLLYDTGVDWTLPSSMTSMPVPYSAEETARMFRRREEQRMKELAELGYSNVKTIHGKQQQQQEQQQQEQQQHHYAFVEEEEEERLPVPNYQLPPSAASQFVTKGVWAYVQLNAAGMPPAVDEAAFTMRYFFATFGGCAPGTRARQGSIMILNGSSLDRVWLHLSSDDVVGLQIGSRCAGPLSFVLRVRDPQRCGAQVLRLVVVCSSVRERMTMVQFLLIAGGIPQLPATILSDFVLGPSTAADIAKLEKQQRAHDEEANLNMGGDTVPTAPMRVARAAALTFGRPNSMRGVSSPATVLDMIERFVRHGGTAVLPEEEEDQDEDAVNNEMSASMNGLALATSFAMPGQLATAAMTTTPHHQHHQHHQQRPRGESAKSTATQDTAVTSGSGRDSSTGGSSDLVQGEYSYDGVGNTPTDKKMVNHLSPSVAAAIEETVLLATADPVSCQLCGVANKAEAPVCRSTGLFHPEYLSARALERKFGGDAAASSVLHFMPPQTVVPRADLTETLRKYQAACKRSTDVDSFVAERQNLEKVCDSVIERYRTECLDLLEEADILLFEAALDDDCGPVKITSKAQGRSPVNNTDNLDARVRSGRSTSIIVNELMMKDG